VPTAQRAVRAGRGDPLGDALLQVGEPSVGLLLGEATVLDGLGDAFLLGPHQRIDQGLDLDTLVLGDLRQGGALGLQRRAQLLHGHVERRGGGRQAEPPAEVATARADAGLAEGGGDLVGLLLGDRAVLDQAGEGLGDPLHRGRRRAVGVGERGHGHGEAGQGQHPGGGGDDQLLAHVSSFVGSVRPGRCDEGGGTTCAGPVITPRCRCGSVPGRTAATARSQVPHSSGRNRGRMDRTRPARTAHAVVLRILLGIALAAVAAVTLSPAGAGWAWGSPVEELHWYAADLDSTATRLQLAGNLGLLMVPAALAVLLWPPLARPPLLASLAMAASAGIELLQWAVPLGRVVSPLDAVLNAAGALVSGFLVAHLGRPRRRPAA
jgi:hypothetical protein